MRYQVTVLVLALLVPGLAAAQDLAQGQAVYDKWCGHCHGAEGDGEGVAATRVQPKPRDFTSGKYKIRMTPTGELPTDDDIQRAIRRGLPYSSMPAFPANFINDGELDDLVAYIKSFSEDFANPEYNNPQRIDIPAPPPYDPEFASTRGKEIYEETGCGRCHGEVGRGDGGSAPTLVDDKGDYIKIADLTKPWTWRGGGTREDIFRTMSTGFAGTPMPGFHGSLPPEDIWAISDYMLYLSGGPQENDPVEAPYANRLTAVGTTEALDLERGKELFADAPPATFPIVGQIIEPGRNFYPAVTDLTVRAVYNNDEVAFLLTWNDMRAETVGTAGPDLQVPLWDEELEALGLGGAAAGGEDDEGDFWGDGGSEEEEGDFWGTGEDDQAAEDDGGDFWGEEEDEGGDFWGDEDEGSGAAGSTGPDNEFNDAVAIQFPIEMPTGSQRPYFIFGDAAKPVDLWFRDLGADAGVFYTGRGSAAIAPRDSDPPETWAQYDNGEWSVIFKRRRKGRGSISFDEGTFVPIAFSVWDGFNRERGNKRGLAVWRYVYMQPLEAPSWQGPALRAGLGVLILEFLIIALVRRSNGKQPETAEQPVAA